MVKREYWLERIEQQWRRRSILWLRGVRRAGKTSLAQSLADVEYFDCELPRVRRTMENPETFLKDIAVAHPDDLGRLWEHFVLNELTAQRQAADLRYWRDKQGHEVDFIWLPRGKPPVAIECKWSARDFDPVNLLVFARTYPKATLRVTTPEARPAFAREYRGVRVEFLTLDRLVQGIRSA